MFDIFLWRLFLFYLFSQSCRQSSVLSYRFVLSHAVFLGFIDANILVHFVNGEYLFKNVTVYSHLFFVLIIIFGNAHGGEKLLTFSN